MKEAHPMAAARRTAGCTLDADLVRAERLLFDLAGELRRVPVHACMHVHLRALQIKRVLMRWNEENPDDVTRHALLAELCTLQREVEALRAGADREDDAPLADAG
jgi:hypothetical protein